MSNEIPWYLRPVEYTDGGHDERQADDSAAEATELYRMVPVGDRTAAKPPGGSTDAAPLDYSRGPHDKAFGVDDEDEA